MNKNTKRKRSEMEFSCKPRKSPLDAKGQPKPKVGYPTKPDALKGPSIMEQMAMLPNYKV